MAELNKAAGDTFTATDCDSIDQQMVIQTTSDRTGVEGRLQARTDLDQVQVYTGSTWRPAIDYGTPASWTPTLTQSGAVTKTITSAVYFEFGSLVVAWFHMSATGAGTGGNAVTISLPVTSAQSNGMALGAGFIYDASGTLYVGTIQQITTTTVGFISDVSGANNWGLTPNVALASGDIVSGQLVYDR